MVFDIGRTRSSAVAFVPQRHVARRKIRAVEVIIDGINIGVVIVVIVNSVNIIVNCIGIVNWLLLLILINVKPIQHRIDIISSCSLVIVAIESAINVHYLLFLGCGDEHIVIIILVIIRRVIIVIDLEIVISTVVYIQNVINIVVSHIVIVYTIIVLLIYIIVVVGTRSVVDGVDDIVNVNVVNITYLSIK